MFLLLPLRIRNHATITTTSKAIPPSTPPTIAPIATTLENVWTGLEESVPAAAAPDDVVENVPTVLPLVLETARVVFEGSLHPMTLLRVSRTFEFVQGGRMAKLTQMNRCKILHSRLRLLSCSKSSCAGRPRDLRRNRRLWVLRGPGYCLVGPNCRALKKRHQAQP